MTTELIRTTILEFIKDLKDNIFSSDHDRGELGLVELFFRKIHTKDIGDYIVKYVLPHEDEIKNRNINFFIKEKTNLFKGLPKDRVDYYSNYIVSGKLNNEDKECIWNYFDVLMELGKKYKKQN